jgi:AraC family transcriptional regulator of arabinose operon
MNVNTNDLIYKYSKINLEFEGIYEITIPPGVDSLEQSTMNGVCGILIPIGGKAHFLLENHSYDLEPGKVLFAGPGMRLDKEVISDSDWHYALIHYKSISRGSEHSFINQFHHMFDIGKKQRPALYQYLDQFKRNYEDASNLSLLKNKRLLYTFIEFILQQVLEREMSLEAEPIQQMTAYIKNNIEKNITVKELADKMDIDPKRFYYLFQKDIGIPPKKYIMTYRIKRAKELLIDGKYSITEVAGMVGYEDVFYFSRIFKKNTGISPSLFRESFEKNAWPF